jgi:hypothetical protein
MKGKSIEAGGMPETRHTERAYGQRAPVDQTQLVGFFRATWAALNAFETQAPQASDPTTEPED